MLTMSPDWSQALQQTADDRRARWLERSRTITDPVDAVHVVRNGRSLVNFSSNNYLGLTHHPHITTAMATAARQFGAGSGAAGLIAGHTSAHASAERAIARWKGTQAAVLLPSGYQSNIAAIGSLAAIGEAHGVGVRFLLDKLCHASLIDAVRGSGAMYRVFPHNGIDKLERLLTERPTTQLQVVVTESIFSMDGDAADLVAISKLKEKHEFLLLVDEAHGSGVYGPGGAGLAAELGVSDAIDVTIATFSKAAGVAGGAVCGSGTLCNALVNHGRAYIYSTAVPAAIAVGIEASLNVMAREPQRSARVRALARRVREGLNLATSSSPVDSPIVPVVLGSEEAALNAAASLLDQGMLVVAVRPPTVPKGASRLRVTLSSEHSDEAVSALVDALRSIRGA